MSTFSPVPKANLKIANPFLNPFIADRIQGRNSDEGRALGCDADDE